MKSAETSVNTTTFEKLICFFTGCFFILLFSVAAFAGEDTATFDIVTETPYDIHGNLSVLDSQLIDQSGEPFIIRGISSSTPELLTAETLYTLKHSWRINTIRLSISPGGDNGYCSLDETSRLSYQNLLVNLVTEARNLGLYVILDWQILEEGDPNLNKETALSFFQSMSLQLQGYDHILYEICGTPNTTATWDFITEYAADIIDIIRSNVPDSIIIIGTPDWSQDLESAMQAPLPYHNVLYSFQFFASSVGMKQRDTFLLAIQNKLPIIVSQFGFTDISNTNTIPYQEILDIWLAFFENHSINYILHDYSNQDTPFALIKSETFSLSDVTQEQLKPEAVWYMNHQCNPNQLSFSEVDLTNAIFPIFWKLDNGIVGSVIEKTNWYGDPASCEYLVTLNNPTDIDIFDWRIRFTWDQDILSIPEFWNCDIGGSGNSRLIISKEYNTVIPSNSTVNFGFVVTGTTSPKLLSLKIE